MTDSTREAAERLFALMDLQPEPRRAEPTEDIYDRWLAAISARVREDSYVAPPPADPVWEPAMMPEFYD